jgi:D-erythronate 2-dehydrogenase
MLGGKLVSLLVRDGVLGGARITRLSLLDVVEPPTLDAPFPVDAVVADIAEDKTARRLVADRPDVIFHLAAVVSGEAETSMETGYRVNLDGLRSLFDAVAYMGPPYCPRLVFSSSIAVFGPPFPNAIADDHCTAPRTSYGVQKAIGELLLSDYSRRGILDGVAIRLPTICVRPGPPNRAASGFFSSIIRDPLNGEEARLPVPDETRHWFASPRSGVGFLLHAAIVDRDLLADRRCLTMPGVSATVAEEIEALRTVAGDEAVELIRREHDETIARIVADWPRRFDTCRALELGFRAEQSFQEIISVYLEDELGIGALKTEASS